MVNMEKASAGTDAKEIVQIEYNTVWAKEIWEIKESAFRRLANALKNNAVKNDEMSKKQKMYWQGYIEGLLFIVDELARDFKQDEESEAQYERHDVI